VIADVIDVAGLGVEVEKKCVTFTVHILQRTLIDGAEVMHAGIDYEVDMGICIRGSDPVAIETNVHLRRGE